MAIIKKIKATVEINDVALKEYKDPAETCKNDTKSVRYIEVPSSAIFKIRVKFAQNFKPQWNSVCARVYVDGVCWVAPLLDRTEDGLHLAQEREILVEGRVSTLPNGKTWLSPFQFRELESDGPVNWNLTAEEVEKFGGLEVKVSNYRKNSTVEGSAEKKTVDEKIPKKLLINTTLTHSVGAGQGRFAKHVFCSGEEDVKPLAIFSFKYRSRRALQKIGIIAEDVPPEELLFSKMTKAELLKKLKAYQAAEKTKIKVEKVEETAVKIKRERDDEVDDILASGTGKKIKPTVSCKVKTVEVIDIDADDEVDAVDVDKHVSRPIVLD